MEEIDFGCEIKKKLEVDRIVVSNDAIKKLVSRLVEVKQKFVVLTDANRENIQSLSNEIKGINFEIINLVSCSATVGLAESLPDKGGELVVAFGSEELVSVAKYYAYKTEKQIIICPIGNFADFTFSCFARLYDGIDFGFYKTNCPSEIYVDTTLNEFNRLQSYYVSSKFIAVFDNLINETVFSYEISNQMAEFFKNTLSKYLKNKSDGIWTLIRLGLAMSYFEETKYFFGADRAIVDLMQSIRPDGDYLEFETVALKLIINAYSCFLESPPFEGNFNINKHINLMSKFLKVPPSVIFGKLSNRNLVFMGEDIKARYKNYQPYLKREYSKLLTKIFTLQARIVLPKDILKTAKLNGDQIKNCFALSPLIYNRNSGLHLIAGFGYLDKLI